MDKTVLSSSCVFYFHLLCTVHDQVTREGHIAVCVGKRGVDVFSPLDAFPTAQSDRHFVIILLPVHKDI